MRSEYLHIFRSLTLFPLAQAIRFRGILIDIRTGEGLSGFLGHVGDALILTHDLARPAVEPGCPVVFVGWYSVAPVATTTTP